jgi:hypothetical protein
MNFSSANLAVVAYVISLVILLPLIPRSNRDLR